MARSGDSRDGAPPTPGVVAGGAGGGGEGGNGAVERGGSVTAVAVDGGGHGRATSPPSLRAPTSPAPSSASTPPPTPTPPKLSPFEASLDPSSTGAAFLSYLDVRSIVHGVAPCSRACRRLAASEALWRYKFVNKWNFSPDDVHGVNATTMTAVGSSPSVDRGIVDGDGRGKGDDGEHKRQRPGKDREDEDEERRVRVDDPEDDGGGFWRGCFASAYANRRHRDGLWLTHWNVVEPLEGAADVPGRCCLPDVDFAPTRAVVNGGARGGAEEAAGTRGAGGDGRRRSEGSDGLPTVTDLVEIVRARDGGAGISASSKEAAAVGLGIPGDRTADCDGGRGGADPDSSEDDGDGDDGVDKEVLDALRRALCPTCRHHPCLPYGDVEVGVAAGAELRYRRRRRSRRRGTAEVGRDDDADDPVLRAEARAVSACASRRGHRGHGRRATATGAAAAAAAAVATTPAEAWYWVAQYGAAKWCRRLADLYGEELLRMAGASDDGEDDDDDEDVVGDARGGDVAVASVGGGGVVDHSRAPGATMSRAGSGSGGEGRGQADPPPGQFEAGRLRRHIRRCRMIRRGRDGARDRARRAFEAAATCGRSIDAEQYRSSGLRFMTDAIFFPTLAATGPEEEDHLIKDVYGEEARTEFLNMLNTGDATASATSKKAMLRPMEPANTPGPARQAVESTKNATPASSSSHTWHVARLTNPSHVRPILWRVLVQRGECFGAYPSDGLLRPGETSHVYFCVFGLGSLMSRSADRIDREREEVDPFVAEIFNAEGPLPHCPFAIRYMFGPVPPCLPRGYNVRKARLSISDYMWQTASPEEVRTIYLNAHVNASYPYEDFRANTLVPFEIRENKQHHAVHCGGRSCGNDDADAGAAAASTAEDAPLTLTSPLLHATDRPAFDILHGIRLDISAGEEGLTYRTERRCVCCGRDWGARSEELARSFLLCKLRWEAQTRLRLVEIGILGNHLGALVSAINDVLPKTERESLSGTLDKEVNGVGSIGPKLPPTTFRDDSVVDDSMARFEPSSPLRAGGDELRHLSRLYKCLFRIRFEILWLRSNPSISFTSRERNLLEEYERRLDETCILYHVGSLQRGSSQPWKKFLIYHSVRCLDSMQAHLSRSENNKTTFSGFARGEPAYLREFMLMKHSAGFVRFKMDDFSQFSSHSAPMPKATVDWLAFVVKIGIAVAVDPRSLFINGVYDRIRSPHLSGQLVAGVDPLFIRSSSCPRSNVDSSKTAALLLLRSRSALASPPLGRGLVHGGWGWKEAHDPDSEGLNLLHLGPLDIDKSRVIANKSFLSEHNSARCDGSTNHAASVPAQSYGGNGISDHTHFVDTRVAEHGEEESHDEQNGLHRQAGFRPQGQADVFPGRDRLRIAQGEQHPRVGRRVVNLVGLVCSYLGWSADDRDAPLVDRRILVAAQWLSNSFALCPLFVSLIARSLMWLTPCPIDYHLEGQPFSANKSLRYLSCEECAYAAIMVFAVWLIMGINNERQTGITSAKYWHLEKLVFEESRSSFYADCGGAIGDRVAKYTDFGLSCKNNTSLKLGVSLIASIASFCTVSPHFALNLLIVFFCGVALGLSMSIESMEMGRETPSLRPFGLTKMKRIKSRHLIVSAFLIGHIVGSSGGIYFLAEFVVTSVSFLLGGVATVSTSAVESWLCFVTFSSAAFWGLFFARVGVLDAMQRKRCGGPSISLLWSLIVASLLWVYVMLFREGEVPTTLMIRRPDRPKMAMLLRKRPKNGSGQLTRLQ